MRICVIIRSKLCTKHTCLRCRSICRAAQRSGESLPKQAIHCRLIPRSSRNTDLHT